MHVQSIQSMLHCTGFTSPVLVRSPVYRAIQIGLRCEPNTRQLCMRKCGRQLARSTSRFAPLISLERCMVPRHQAPICLKRVRSVRSGLVCSLMEL